MYRFCHVALLATAFWVSGCAATPDTAARPAATTPPPSSPGAHDHSEERAPAIRSFDAADEMWMVALGDWHLMAMGHVYPSVTVGAPRASDTPLRRTDLRFPHAAAMANLESPGSRWVFRLMPNFEGLTLADGEPTFGAWGEGFIDSRHPHTLLHEAAVSLNWWEAPGGAASLTAGRGFAPYGTDDPMYRPALKYPTNHHLSQILERWTVNAVYASDRGWSAEAGLFDGDEPEDWLDLSNIGNFGNSWSARLAHRFGPERAWEVSVSHGRVKETHGGDHTDLTRLYNAAVRHEGQRSFGRLYALAEASTSDPDHGEGYRSVLAEASLASGPHQPFVRIETATRPEYPRDGGAGEDFFRYDHDASARGATRWTIATAGYAYGHPSLRGLRPFVEVHHHQVRRERGPPDLDPTELLGARSFWSVAFGARIFVGGGPMRMGRYGVLDPMTRGMREGHEGDAHAHDGPHPMGHGADPPGGPGAF